MEIVLKRYNIIQTIFLTRHAEFYVHPVFNGRKYREKIENDTFSYYIFLLLSTTANMPLKRSRVMVIYNRYAVIIIYYLKLNRTHINIYEGMFVFNMTTPYLYCMRTFSRISLNTIIIPAYDARGMDYNIINWHEFIFINHNL